MTASGEPEKRRADLSLTTIAECPFSIALEYATEFLREIRDSQRRRFRGSWLRLPMPFVFHHDTLFYELKEDDLETGRAHDEIRLNWRTRSVFLTNLRAVIRVRIFVERTQLICDVEYDAPRGPLGQLLETCIFRPSVSNASAAFITQLTDHLGAAHRCWMEALTKATARDVNVGESVRTRTAYLQTR